MAEMEVEVVGLQELVVKLTNIADGMNSRVEAAIMYETNVLEQTVKDNMARLFANPLRMQQSVSGDVKSDQNTITGTVSASGLPYLEIQEFGGRTSPHKIFPINGKVLAFLWPGRLGFSGGPKTTPMAFFRSVKHPGAKMPERSFMRASLAQRKAAILNSIRMAAGAFQ